MAAGQTFSIDVDLTQMTHGTHIPGITGYVSPQLLHLTLAPGDYEVSYQTGVDSPIAPFTVTVTGMVNYASALEGILEGAGTNTLLVNGAAIEIDFSQMTPGLGLSGVTGFVPPQVLNKRLLPGGHSLTYNTPIDSPVVDFTVLLDGTVDYVLEFEGILEGSGTSNLLVNGLPIVADFSQMTPGIKPSGSPYFLSPQVFMLRYFPGDHHMSYNTAIDSPVVYFTVFLDGTVGYAPELEGILEGAGTSDLLVNGRTIVADFSQMTPGIKSSGTIFLPPQVTTLTYFPGGHRMFYNTAGNSPLVDFTVLLDGTVDYALELEGILEGAGTSDLLVNGIPFRIATGDVNGGIFRMGGVCNSCLSCETIRVFPGGHLFTYTGIVDESSFEFEATLDSVIEFDPILDTTVLGRGTGFIQLPDVDSSAAVCSLPPVAICSASAAAGGGESGSAITLECNDPGGVAVMLDGSSSFDPDDDELFYHWDVSNLSVVLDNPDSAIATGIFPHGITMATLTVADGQGGVATCDVLITVQDTTPPEVMCTTDAAALWPPNHTMRTVTIVLAGTDACSAPEEIVPLLVTIRSDEPDNEDGLGDGDTTGDVNGQDGYSAPVDITDLLVYDDDLGAWITTVQLRAERDGVSDGRAYILDIMAIDSHMNVSLTSCVVVVPHDRRPSN